MKICICQRFSVLYFFPKLQNCALVDLVGVAEPNSFIYRYFSYYRQLLKQDADYDHVYSFQRECMCVECVFMHVCAEEGERKIRDFWEQEDVNQRFPVAG